MTSLEFSIHARERLHLRRVTRKQVAEAIQRPDSLFKDTESSSLVAVKKTNHRYLVVIYVPRVKANRVVTVYHASDVNRLIRRKLGRGVWTEA